MDGYGRLINCYGYYAGGFKADKYHGQQGTEVKFGNNTYVGAWKFGMRHGPGINTDSYGKVEEGEWFKDKLLTSSVQQKYLDDANELCLPDNVSKYSAKSCILFYVDHILGGTDEAQTRKITEILSDMPVTEIEQYLKSYEAL